MIVQDQQDGRWKTVTTPEESSQNIVEAIRRLNSGERAALRQILQEAANNNTKPYDILQNLEYEERPCPPSQFLEDPQYLGEIGKGTYPWIKKALPRIFNEGFDQMVFTGATRTGKDWMASCCIAYLIHILLCLKDPAVSYGIAKGSNIYIVFLSATQELSREAMFNGLVEKLRQSSWFMKFGKTMKILSEDIRFPKGIMLKGAESGDLGVVGLNVCVTGDTLIRTPSGEMTVEDLKSRHGDQPFPILNYSGVIETDTAFITPTGEQDVFEMTLSDGTILKATENHRILVRVSGETMLYRTVGELKDGDDIVTEKEVSNSRIPWFPMKCAVCGTEGFTAKRKVEWCSSKCFYVFTKRMHAKTFCCVICGKSVVVEGAENRKSRTGGTCGESCDKELRRRRMMANNPFKGKHHSEETKKFISEFRKGKKFGPRPRHSEFMKRRWKEIKAILPPKPVVAKAEKQKKQISTEEREAMRIRKIAYWTPERRKGQSERMKHFRHTPEGKAKIAASNSKRECSEQTRDKMSLSISLLHQRSVKNYQYKGYATTRFGTFGYRSTLEKHALKIFDQDQNVTVVEPETFMVPYVWEGKKRRCLPDFKITSRDGSKKVVEVKSTFYQKWPIMQAKIEATRKFCQSRNWGFELWDENDICRMLGIKKNEIYEQAEKKKVVG
jgi:hypothetical protein